MISLVILHEKNKAVISCDDITRIDGEKLMEFLEEAVQREAT